jgi:hypothetical protein
LLSWGPPHDPYGTRARTLRKLFDPAKARAPPNVQGDPSKDLAGYYAHIAAMETASATC